jgi:hypothetical protein
VPLDTAVQFTVSKEQFQVGPCHHLKACPEVVDEVEGLQLLRLAATTLNKQSRTADKGLSSSLRDGRGGGGSQQFIIKKQLGTKCYTGPQNGTDSSETLFYSIFPFIYKPSSR